VAWYEAQKPGLGAEFLSEVERCVANAAERPELYGAVRGEIRRVVTRRFPYSIYYRLRAHCIVVLAVSMVGGTHVFGRCDAEMARKASP
jgi:plasmid stabilization system protein ParE